MTHRSDSGFPLSRRTAMTGLAAALGSAVFVPVFRSTSAQDATPASSPAAVEEISYLFVQTGFTSGTLEPATESGVFLLTLQGATEQTIWFSDRPNRVAGLVATAVLLETLGFEEDPPNAALLIKTENGESDVVILELTAPLYDPASATLSFMVTVLADEMLAASGLGFTEQPLDSGALPTSFGSSSLFIDSLAGCSPWDPRC